MFDWYQDYEVLSGVQQPHSSMDADMTAEGVPDPIAYHTWHLH